MGATAMVKTRNANMDLLRMLSMLMVTMLHALGKSGLLQPMGESLGINGWLAWILESLSIGAVDIFMILSGYFLIRSEYKTERLIELLCQTFFYTFGTFFVYWVGGALEGGQKDIYHLLQYYLPVHMNVYWFITVYVILYLLLPVLSAGARQISQRQLKKTILLLLLYECIFKSILPFRLSVDEKGYSLLWYLILFLMGAYVRLYGFQAIKKAWQGWLLYFVGSGGVFAELILLHGFSERTGRLKEITGISLDYNHLFVCAAAMGIFAAFLLGRQLPSLPGRIVCALSPLTLGVYLFQETILLRYEWQKWFGLSGALREDTLVFLGRLFGAVAVMYLLGTVADFFRRLLFKGIKKVFGGGHGKRGVEE